MMIEIVVPPPSGSGIALVPRIDRAPKTAMTPINFRNSFCVTLMLGPNSLQARAPVPAPLARISPLGNSNVVAANTVNISCSALRSPVRTTAGVVLVGLALALAWFGIRINERHAATLGNSAVRSLSATCGRQWTLAAQRRRVDTKSVSSVSEST